MTGLKFLDAPWPGPLTSQKIFKLHHISFLTDQSVEKNMEKDLSCTAASCLSL